MQVQFKASELFTVVAEGNTHTELFSNLAGLTEIFSITSCGKCGSLDIIPVKRIVDDVSHYEMRCRKCNARLTLAQSKKGGGLYPRRRYHEKQFEVQSGRAKEGDFIPNNGWQIWSGERNDESEKKSI